MRFVFRMVLRELRASWRRWLFFFMCVAVGVGTVVALRSTIQSVALAMASETRALTAADVTIESEQPWSEVALSIINDTLAEEPEVERTASVEMTTMARPEDESKAVARVVELRAVEAAFPFYGTFVLDGGHDYRHAHLSGGGALVRPELLAQLGVTVGDNIVIGEIAFEIRGVILQEPGGQLGAFSFGPRVLIDRADLISTGLLGPGVRAERQFLVRVPEERIATLVTRLRERLGEEFIRVRSYRNTEDRLARNLSRAENYLSLVGFVIVMLGGIGVWSVTRVFVQQRIRSVAILKCLGATNRQVLAIYVTQVLVLGLLGSMLGVALAGGLLAFLPGSLSESVTMPVGMAELSYRLTISAVVQGVGVGIFVSLLFALGPLLEVSTIKPLSLLRWGLVPTTSWDWKQIAVVVALVVGLITLASWQAASWEAGLWVCGGFAVVAVVLHLAGQAFTRVIQWVGARVRFPVQYAVLNLARPGNQTRVILLAVGLGSFLIIGIHSVQANLVNAFALEVREDSPDMFLIDIQQNQADGVIAFLSERLDSVPSLLPVLRARVTGVTGQQTTITSVAGVRRGGVGREYTVTYRDRLEANERVVEGAFWEGRLSNQEEVFEVSVEESVRDRLQLMIGDVLRFDILGREISATVSSVRAVDWDDSRSGGFMFLFRPGALEDAPHTFISFIQGPTESVTRATLQRELVDRFPNVSAIDGLEILRTFRRMLDYATVAISAVGGIAFFSGGLILAGSVAMTKYQRLYETAILKTLGATSRSIALMLAVEYCTLGAVAGLIGSFGALGLTWGLTKFLLEIHWVPLPSANLAGFAFTLFTVGVLGVTANWDVLWAKPLRMLRGD